MSERRTITVEARFWPKVDRRGPDECWPWLGTRSTRGYGLFWADGKYGPAHRRAWELTHGESIPATLEACHTCDNPPCVNPAHIFPATHQENGLDASAKGRLHLGGTRQAACRNGHPYTEGSYRLKRGKWRICKACDQIGQHNNYLQRKARRVQAS